MFGAIILCCAVTQAFDPPLVIRNTKDGSIDPQIPVGAFWIYIYQTCLFSLYVLIYFTIFCEYLFCHVLFDMFTV